MATCGQCGTENPEQAKFCFECAAPLAAVAPERRERRVVSVLFADLAGFTSRSESLDVEDVEGFLAPYLAVLRSEVERTGGVVVKFTGDGVMAIFGAGTAHEDDPERAVRSALGICERVADAGDADLRVRVGVTSGEALVSYDPAGGVDAVGDVVNTAARLESAAPLGGVLVDGWTYRATERAIRYQPAEAVAAKGKSEPVEAWVAVAARSIVPEQMRVGGLPLVGRDAEADVLRGALDRARREPSVQLVSIIGEPGIGKTRLVEELFDYVEQLPELITWRRGRSLAYGEGVAFWALGEMVKAQAGILESDAADVAEARLDEAVEAVILDERDRAWVVRHLRPLVGVESPDSRGGEHGQLEAFAAWRRFFEALAEDRPTVLWFEDIHWADDALLDFIDLLADRAGGVPLLVVCTARPELFERRPAWGGGKPNASTLSLTALSGEDTARLVASMLDQALLPVEVQAALLERAEGNPLYAQEYVRMLQDRGLLVRTDGGWTLKGEITDDLPESIHGIIAARLDTLTSGERRFLQAAAVIGKTSWVGAVCALTDERGWQAGELLHSLERKQLLQRARRSSVSAETEFTFTHALTKDVAYSQIRRLDRAAYHEQAAAWIVELAGEREDKAEVLADHYHQALRLREVLGEDVTALVKPAREAFAEAGRQAQMVFAHLPAARHYEAALRLTPVEDQAQRATLLLGGALAKSAAGIADATMLETVLTSQVEAQHWLGAARLERLLAYWYTHHHVDQRETELHLARAAGYAARIPPTEELCHIIAAQTASLFLSGRNDDAFAMASKYIPIAERAGLAVGRAILVGWRGRALCQLGDTDEGVTDIRQAAQVLADHADPVTAAVYGNFADTLRGLGEMSSADEAYTIAASQANRFGKRDDIDWIAAERAAQAYHAARWSDADQLIRDIDRNNHFNDYLVRATTGRMSLACGETEAALCDANAIVSYADASGNAEARYYGEALRVLCRQMAEPSNLTQPSLTSFLAHLQSAEGYTTRSVELCEVAPALAHAGRHLELRHAATLLPERSHWRRALLLIVDHRYADAATLYEQIGSRPLAADAHLLAARQAADHGRTADGQQHAEAVLAFAKQTGASLYQQRAEAFVKASA